jgi:hypothetical protein
MSIQICANDISKYAISISVYINILIFRQNIYRRSANAASDNISMFHIKDADVPCQFLKMRNI